MIFRKKIEREDNQKQGDGVYLAKDESKFKGEGLDKKCEKEDKIGGFNIGLGHLEKQQE
jgi:hypothetical protein